MTMDIYQPGQHTSQDTALGVFAAFAAALTDQGHEVESALRCLGESLRFCSIALFKGPVPGESTVSELCFEWHSTCDAPLSEKYIAAITAEMELLIAGKIILGVHPTMTEIVLSPVFSLHSFWGTLLCSRNTPQLRLTEMEMLIVKEASNLLGKTFDRLDYERRLIESRRIAESADDAKRLFLAHVSHEIRTPMNGILGMVEILLDSGLSPNHHRYAEIIRSSAESMMTIVNDILDYSKIEAGKISIEAHDFDLMITVKNILEIYTVRAQEKGVLLTSFIDPQLPALFRGDPGRIRQVFMNLIGNALKFTERGEIYIRVEAIRKPPLQGFQRDYSSAFTTDYDEEKRLFMKLGYPDMIRQGIPAGVGNETQIREPLGNPVWVLFSILDTGIGIPADKVDTLFQPFTQVDASTTRKYGGTGLGLSISKRLIDLMDGRIGFETVFGRGTHVWFAVPLQIAEIKPPSPILGVDLAGRRILVADESAVARRWFSKLFDGWHCIHDEMGDSDSVLSAIETAAAAGNPYSIVIIDKMVPTIQGEELGRTIRERQGPQSPMLVMITGVGERGDVTRLSKLGFAGYLTKPITDVQLHDCLAMVLGRNGQPSDRQAEPVTRHTLSEAKKLNYQILLVEDNLINQKVALRLIQKYGYSADCAVNGKEALDALEKKTYDLVFMDVQMPEMDGIEATKLIRSPLSLVKNHQIPIVAITAHAMVSHRQMCLDAGMDDYITKPVQTTELLKMLQKYLPASDA